MLKWLTAQLGGVLLKHLASFFQSLWQDYQNAKAREELGRTKATLEAIRMAEDAESRAKDAALARDAADRDDPDGAYSDDGFRRD